MSGGIEGWTARLSAWANVQGDIDALIQIGSRVQSGAVVDSWSDFDYQIVTSAPKKYRTGSFVSELGPCWAVGRESAFGNVTKVTAVYDGALEVDFVVVPHWEIRVATAALSWPSTEPFWPRSLAEGIANLRIVAAPGWKVVKGGTPWERRYARLKPTRVSLALEEFGRLTGEFWVHLIWAAKKAQRGEWIASQRTFHLYLVETCLRFYAEEGFLAGRRSYPLGRRAESWMNTQELKSLSGGTRPDKAALLGALRRLGDEFASVSESIASLKKWPHNTHTEVRAWLATLD
jgi:hypothetical protein